jgi:hypothetical protein
MMIGQIHFNLKTFSLMMLYHYLKTVNPSLNYHIHSSSITYKFRIGWTRFILISKTITRTLFKKGYSNNFLYSLIKWINFAFIKIFMLINKLKKFTKIYYMSSAIILERSYYPQKCLHSWLSNLKAGIILKLHC